LPDDVKQSFARIPTDEDEQVVFEWLLERGGRPVYTSTKRRAPGWEALDTGLLYRMARPGAAPAPHNYWADYTWHTLNDDAIEGDWSAELILFEYHFARGRFFFDGGLPEAGLRALDHAKQLARENKDGLNNLGSAYAEYGRTDLAVYYFQEALALDPAFDIARRNLAKAYMDQGRYAAALEPIDRLLERGPADAVAQRLRAECAGRLDAPPAP
jgi:tetratricopeptide (TPR) repeat protein